MKILFFFLLCLLAANSKLDATGGLFESVAELQQLSIYASERVQKVFQDYIRLELERLQHLEEIAWFYQRLRVVQTSSSNKNFLQHRPDPQSVLNPLNAYRLIKTLGNAWKTIQSEIKAASSELAETFLRNISRSQQTRFPTEEDVNGAVRALFRLQDTYQLETGELASGIVDGVKTEEKNFMSAFDCFEIGRIAYEGGDYFHALLWLQEAFERRRNKSLDASPTKSSLSSTKNQILVEEAQILELLSHSLYKQGNLKRALASLDLLHEISPSHPNVSELAKRYEQELLSSGVPVEELRKEIPPLVNNRRLEECAQCDNNSREFEALCRGGGGDETAGAKMSLSESAASKLSCYYKMDRPFLRLAPFKVEILHFDPLVALFRNVVSDGEIEEMLKSVFPRLERSRIENYETGKGETTPNRISKSAWLNHFRHPVVGQLRNRTALFSNLNMNSAEALQFANYGIGGHFTPHCDYKNGILPFIGSRIATVLFYLSQPEKGGATVFPQIGTAVRPSKNDAILWYNLMRNGEGDPRTEHAACPVLLGEKWIATFWIHERGQEFLRPCALDESGADERFV